VNLGAPMFRTPCFLASFLLLETAVPLGYGAGWWRTPAWSNGESASLARRARLAEATVLRKLSLLALCGGVLVPWAATRAQDAPQPSVAEAARQARANKDKSATQPKKVLTNDDVASGTSGSSAGTAALSSITVPSAAEVSARENAVANGGGAGAASSANGFPSAAAAAAAGGDDPMSKAWAGIANAEGSLDRMAPLDRKALAKVVLEGNDVDFPGRAAWEDRLYAAKERYVAHSRQLIEQMKDLMAGAQAAQGAGADSPQGQDLMSRAQRLMADATSTENAFKSVMEEGQSLARQAAHK
jgi:hypothetical protein